MSDTSDSYSSSSSDTTHNQDTSSPPEPGPVIREHFGLRADPPSTTATNAEWDRLQVAKAEVEQRYRENMGTDEWTPYLTEAELEERRGLTREQMAKWRRKIGPRAYANYPVRSKLECEIRQAGDSTWCDKCDLAWDTNDPEPPACPHSTMSPRLSNAIGDLRRAERVAHHQRVLAKTFLAIVLIAIAVGLLTWLI